MHQGWGWRFGTGPRCCIEKDFLILGHNRPKVSHTVITVRGMGFINARVACYLAVTTPSLPLILGNGSVNDEPSALSIRIPKAVVPKHYDASIFQAYQSSRGIRRKNTGWLGMGPLCTVFGEGLIEAAIRSADEHPDAVVSQLNNYGLNHSIAADRRHRSLELYGREMPTVSPVVRVAHLGTKTAHVGEGVESRSWRAPRPRRQNTERKDDSAASKLDHRVHRSVVPFPERLRNVPVLSATGGSDVPDVNAHVIDPFTFSHIVRQRVEEMQFTIVVQ